MSSQKFKVWERKNVKTLFQRTTKTPNLPPKIYIKHPQTNKNRRERKYCKGVGVKNIDKATPLNNMIGNGEGCGDGKKINSWG